MSEKIRADVCVYGGTSGGVIAAIAVAQQGRSVVLVEPGRHLGGMTSGGIGLTDFGRKETIGGLSREFYRRVEEYYRHDDHHGDTSTAGPDHPEGRGWTHEPHVAEMIFRDWLADYGVPIIFNSRISVARKTSTRLRSITLDYAPPDHRGAPAASATEPGYLEVEAAMFIDASYEGDLIALTGVSYTTQRESRAQYDESLAGVCYSNGGHNIDPYRQPGQPESGLLPLVSSESGGRVGAASSATQAYTFRLCLVQDAGVNRGNMMPVEPPANYNVEIFELWARRVQGLVNSPDPPTATSALYHYPPYYYPPPYFEPSLFKISPLPRGKSDVNHLNWVGGSFGYADGDWSTRVRIWHDHEDYQRGLLYFLRTDERMPQEWREEIGKWGLPKDEYSDSGGWPHQLYIRESRRMLGSYTVTQHDCQNPTIEDSIGLGSHQLDSHGCRLLACEGRVVHEGGFFQDIPAPYPIPYRALIPREGECDNLLVLFCLSSSHAAYSSLRMEPVLMILGQSAGTAACHALGSGQALKTINTQRLQSRLRDAGQLLSWETVSSDG
jgi:hypothetical protein